MPEEKTMPNTHDAIRLDSRFAKLKSCHTEVYPDPVPEPEMAHFNFSLADALGLDPTDEMLLEILSGNRPWPGYAPIASVYAGHQFGSWVPRLGDGRAHMIAEIARPDGKRMELQLKGSGKTPYSRGADGRAVLRSSIREYLCSEAMHALGVPTTRCLSLVSSPLPVIREKMETAAVVCRVSPSFVRFGHFEYFSRDKEVLASLADHVISENFSHLEGPGKYASWLSEVVERTAKLMAKWQSIGFCHGVMNTDNFSILGLTIDYGPFGFMDAFRQHHVCNHSDYEGRYAYGAQPEIGLWNISCLLQATYSLLSEDEDEGAEMAS
nr:protein adenylyltransferase SelO family protein [Burkholderiales bacterium]